MGELPLILEVCLHAGDIVPFASFQLRDLDGKRVLLLASRVFRHLVEEV